MIDTASIRGSRDTLIAALTAAGARIRGTAFQCPFHEDSTPPGSGSVFQKDGVWRARCHAASCEFAGDALDVEARSRGMTVEDLIRERNGQQPRPATAPPALAPAAPPDAETKNLRPYPTLEALTLAVGSSPGIDHVEDVTPSTNPDTQNVDIVTFRCRTPAGEKTFRIGHQAGGQWYMTAPPKPWPLFNRTRLRQTEFAIVVEGEKCMKALVNLSVPVTTGVGGAGKSAHHDWEPLRGKTVYLWPDADAPNPKTGLSGGVEHMKAVAEILQRIECDVHMIDPFAMGLRDGDDVVDWLERNPGTKSHQTDLIDRVLLDAKPLPGASEDLALRLEDCIAGRYATVPFPWTALTRETAALRPGTLTLVCGDPGSTKCLSPWTKLLRHDGTITIAGQVSVGDKLMGDDSTPRTVQNVVNGRDEMYRIVPIKGEPFTVSGNHILCYVFKTRKKVRGRTTFPGWTYAEESVREFMARPAGFREKAKLYRVAVEFPEQAVPLDPYFLGVWLGDGCSRWPLITTADPEIVAACVETAALFGLKASVHRNKNKTNGRAVNVRISGPDRKTNPVTEILKDLCLLRNKHIPQQYLSNSRENRLQLLAGLIDTDGCMGSANRKSSNCCIIQKSKRLADQLSLLANTLGFQSSVWPITSTIKSRGFSGTYYRVSVNGDLSVIPTRIPRKKAAPRRQKKDVLHTGFTIEPAGRGSFVSIEVDGNHLHLLADCTVVHNSFFGLECLLHWTRVGVPASAFELEEDRAYWLHRILAVQVGDGQVTSPEWCREHPDDVRQLYANNRKLLDQVAARLWASPDDPPTYRAVLEWIEQRAAAGDRVIIVDPLTAITTSTDRFLEDLEFMTRAKKIARVHGCSLILVTHPRKTGKTRSPLEDMAGGAAYPRFSQSVLWLRTERPPARGTVAVSGGKGAASWNRSCIIAKARNAAGGGGGIIAFDFVGAELRFAERGVVLDDEPDND